MKNPVDLTTTNDIKRILVIRWSALGDVVIASAVLEDISHAFPSCEIHLNTSSAHKHLFENDPRFTKILTPEVRKGGLRGIRDWLCQVRSCHYDLIIDLQCNDRSRLLIILLLLSGQRIPYRAGNKKRFPYNYYPLHTPPRRQAIQVFMDIARSVGVTPFSERPVLHIPEQSYENARKLTAKHALKAGHYAVLFPGSQAGGYLKRWGATRYAKLAQILHEQGIQVTLIGGPDDTNECDTIKRDCGEWLINLCSQTQILDIIPLCEQACFIISNDTGTAHIASATEQPMVVICGPTDPRRVKPCGDNAKTIQADLPCINCYRKECSHHSCMPAITPEQVLDTLGAEIIAACSN